MSKVELNPIVEQYLSAGQTVVPVYPNGKAPTIRWKNFTVPTDEEGLAKYRKELAEHEGNFGIIVGKNDLIIDADVKNGAKGEDSFLDLEIVLGTEIPKTVITPSGGWHCYIKFPEDVDTKDLSETISDYPGIDFKHHGTHVVIPPSIGANEKEYVFAEGVTGFTQNDAPDSLLGELSKVKQTATPAKKTTPAKEPTTTPAVEEDGKITLTVDTDNVSEYEKWPVEMVQDMLNYLDPAMCYDEWKKVGMALHHWDIVEGLKLWNAWSSKCEGKIRHGELLYKIGECEFKWGTFNSDRDGCVKLGSIVEMAKDNGYKPKSIKTNTNTDTPEEDGEIPEWCQDWVRVRSGDKYFNKKTRVVESYRGFNSENGKYVPAGNSGGKISAVKFVDDNGFIESVEDFYYQPTSTDSIIEVRGVKYANTYDPTTKLTPATNYTDNGRKAIKLVQEHIRHIFGNEKVDGYDLTRAELFEAWISHQYQRPGQLLFWAPLLQSKQGLGKSYFRRLLKDLLGGSNVRAIFPKDLKSDFTAWGRGKAVSVLEELEVPGRSGHEVYKTLKPFITDSDVEVIEKGKDSASYDNYSNYIAFTNSKKSLPLEPDDRRFWVTFCPIATDTEFENLVGKKKADYFKELIAATTNHADEIAKHFQEYEITKEFESITEAPDSAEKQMMINAENASIEGLSEIEKIIEDEKTPFVTADVFSSADLFKAYEAENHKLTKHQKSLILENLGCTALDPVKIGKFTKRLWITRDITKKEAVQTLKDHNARIGYHDVDLPEIKFSMGK